DFAGSGGSIVDCRLAQRAPGNIEALADRVYIGKIGRPRRVTRIIVTHLHAVGCQRIHSRFDRGEATIRAKLGAFTRQEVLGRVHEIVGNPRFVDLREGAQRSGSVAGFLLPIAVGPVRGRQRIDVLDGLDLREVVNIGWARQAAEISLFAGIGFDRFLEGLIRGDPKILAQRIVVAIDAHVPRGADESTKALLADEIGAVRLVIPNPRGNTHLAYAAVIRRNQRAEFGHNFADVHIKQAIFHVVGADWLIRLRDL